MRKLHLILIFSMFFGAFSLSGALKQVPREKIAVAEPKVHKGVSAEEVAGVSDYLEGKLGAKFQIFSRAALDDILKEDAFNQSGMVVEAGSQKALAQQAVDCILVYSISRPASNYVVSLRVVDRSTGEVRPGMAANFFAGDVTQIYAKLDIALDKMGLLDKQSENVKRAVILPAKGSAQSPASIVAGYSTKLASKLQQTGLFEIVSRDDLEKIAAESKLATSALADAEDLHKIAELRVADYVVIPSIPDYRNREISTSTTIAGTTQARHLMSARVEYRIVEVKSGKIVAQGDGHIQLRNTDIPADIRRDWAKSDYDDAFCEYAARWTIRKMLDTLDPLTVAAVDGNTLYLSRSVGVSIGEIYHIYTSGREIVHPHTGKILGKTSGSPVATCRITQIADGMAIAQLTGKATGEIEAGAVCRSDQITDPVAEGNYFHRSTSAPAYPMAK